MSRSKNKRSDSFSKAPHSKLKKDPGVPKLPSLKAKQSLNRKHPRVEVPNHDPDAPMASEPTLASLAAQAQEMDGVAGLDEDVSSARRRQFVRTLHRVVDASDVVLLVLDARDPPGSRSRLVEEEVRRRDKKLVFILNKIDLVPRENAEAWLAYLRHEAATLPFRASTQSQRANLSTRTAPALLHLLKSLRKGPAGSITVGVVGAPNVGKSSLINSLKRSRVCAIAAEPGCTTDLQTVVLERGVKIVDSPGVVFDDGAGAALLRNVLSVDDIADPIAVVETIVARTDPEALKRIYKVLPFSSAIEFLTMVSLTSGRLGKGGAPDTEAAARVVLRDWNRSKIPFFTDVPKTHASDTGETAIVSQFAPAFDLGALYAADHEAFMDVEPEPEPAPNAMQQDGDAMEAEPTPSKKRKRDEDDDDGPEHWGEDSMMSEPGSASLPPSTAASSERPAKRQRTEAIPKPKRQGAPAGSPVAAHDASLNPLGRKALKLARKRAAKAERRAAAANMTVDDDGSGPAPLPFTFSVPQMAVGEVEL
ncbi:P-loop containing nucleoside triphosphate hydrolase protein [Auricularia subglabra TFB-10046 SS5]|uniref:p-loop containing nucleoside triphosphate hydrolase protein n=1 Tax=Auricularia subglabra (strain TFB-10046 / SS5) TaxID=717982 RepID=J0D261_AURST|nr:P-loop containing nucleoside triphosphate hydrolase protein [Auricularia subglabra TFB-10046 SS5]